LRCRAGFCYLCKVLVGLGTPYLGPDFKTRTASLPAFPGSPPQKPGKHPDCRGEQDVSRASTRTEHTQLYRVSQFEVPGRFGGSLGLEQPTDCALSGDRARAVDVFCFVLRAFM
jgi:hypothetical protein